MELSRAPGNILLPKGISNLLKESVINISHIITIDKSFLTECVGTISKSYLGKWNTVLS